MIPLKSEQDLRDEEEERKAELARRQRNEQDLYKELEGRRHDVELAPIPEKTENDTEEQKKGRKKKKTQEEVEYKVQEYYPLKRPTKDAEVLLVSFSDAKQCLQEKIGFKCDDVQMETPAKEKIE